MRSLLITEPITVSTPKLTAIKSKIAIACLRRQVQLNRETILHLHDTFYKMESSSDWIGEIADLWVPRHIKQFYAILANSNSNTIRRILYALFR